MEVELNILSYLENQKVYNILEKEYNDEGVL